MHVITFLKKEAPLFNISELAKRAGVPYQVLQKHMKDKSKVLQTEDLKKLEKTLAKYGFTA